MKLDYLVAFGMIDSIFPRRQINPSHVECGYTIRRPHSPLRSLAAFKIAFFNSNIKCPHDKLYLYSTNFFLLLSKKRFGYFVSSKKHFLKLKIEKCDVDATGDELAILRRCVVISFSLI